MAKPEINNKNSIEKQEQKQEQLQQKFLQFQMFQQQIEQINQHLEMLTQQSAELEISINAVKEIGQTKVDQEILAPIAGGIFLQAQLKDNQKLIVNVGSGITVEKTNLQVIELLQQQQAELMQKIIETDSVLQQLSAQAMKIYQEVQKAQQEQD
jgi:prefoldin alpha subunit